MAGAGLEPDLGDFERESPLTRMGKRQLTALTFRWEVSPSEPAFAQLSVVY